MRPVKFPRSLSAKLVAIGAGMLMLALASIGLTLWVTWQLEGGAAAVNEAGRMRMQTWRLASVMQSDPRGAQALSQRFDDSLALLAGGDPSRPLFVPWDDDTRRHFDDVRAQWQALRAQWLGADPPPPARVASQADAFVASIDGFVSGIERQLSRWTAVLDTVQMAMMALAIGSAVALLYAGYLFVVDPLNRLKAGLRRIEAGEFDARVEVASRDEFGELSAGFNRMAHTLQSLYRGLEDKVQEKTARLEVKRERLAALYDVAAFLSHAGTLEELAVGFVQKVRRIARADAAAIRWSDEANERYLLLAGDCLPRALSDGEACLATGSCHCGQAQQAAATRVIPIRADGDDTRFGHCARAGYETLVSVPVMLHQRVLGEIDLFYRGAAELADDDRSLLETLASHLASAMESLRAAVLEREAAVAGERGLIARELHDSIAQSLAFLKIQVQLLRGAVERGDKAATERAIAELDTGVRESYADVRELLVHFRTRTNAEDIEPALRTTLQKFEHQTGLATELGLQGHSLPLAPDVQVQLLHVVQEALSNVRKHAQAGRVRVDVQRGPIWRIEVADDGRGFDVAGAAPDETHVGLRIMRERAARIGATVEVDSTPGRGTRVVLSLPAAVPSVVQPLAA